MSYKANRGFALIEYAMLIIIVIVGLIICKQMILRGINGHWKTAGDAFGLGRQYDPQRTTDCVYDGELRTWYDQGCFDYERQNCPIGNLDCERSVIANKCSTDTCADQGEGTVTISNESISGQPFPEGPPKPAGPATVLN